MLEQFLRQSVGKSQIPNWNFAGCWRHRWRFQLHVLLLNFPEAPVWLLLETECCSRERTLLLSGWVILYVHPLCWSLRIVRYWALRWVLERLLDDHVNGGRATQYNGSVGTTAMCNKNKTTFLVYSDSLAAVVSGCCFLLMLTSWPIL